MNSSSPAQTFRHRLAVSCRRLVSWLAALARPPLAELAELDDCTLRDIGLTRGEIMSVQSEFCGHRPATRRGVIEALNRAA
jgi:uncharacterized protein YjiS (DUF1127 family)